MSKEQVPSVNYKNIFITGFISLLVAVLGSLLINKITAEKLGLEYEIVTSEVFSASSGNVQIATIYIGNHGTKNIDDVTATVATNGGVIKEYKIIGLHKDAYNSRLEKNEVDLSAKFLNPDEKFNIQLLLSGDKASNFLPKIDLRGRGVIGKPKKVSNDSALINLIVPAAFGILAVYFVPLLRRKFFPQIGYTSQHSDDPRDVVAYILGISGLIDEAKEIRMIDRDISYWSICDYLSEKWISEGDKEKCLLGAQTLEKLIDYASISDTSEMLVHTCISNLYKKASNSEKSNAAAHKAFETRHKVIEKRLNHSEIDVENA